MAIRTPGRYTQRWYYEDVLEYEVKEHPAGFAVFDPDAFYPWYTYQFDLKESGEGFWEMYPDASDPILFKSLKVKLFDDPPTNKSQLFNNEVASIEYEVQGKLITIIDWENYNWRDEWPIRLGLNYLTNCLYRPGHQYVFRVVKDPIAFWQSERFLPISHDDPYLVRGSQWIARG